MKKGWVAILTVLAASMLAGGGMVVIRARPTIVKRPGGSAASAPDGQRVVVEVVNATKVRGLARRATMLLRDHGFDVVEIETSNEPLDSTVVLDRSGHPDWAKRVAAALSSAGNKSGRARVESRPDTSRYLDVTVLLGATWRPPAEPFYP